MKERKPEPNGRLVRVKRPLHTATPGALARALLRPLTPPDPSLRKGEGKAP